MKKLIGFIFLFAFILITCQKSKPATFVDVCYLPNGGKCPLDFYKNNMTYGEFQKNFEHKGRVWDAYLPDDRISVSFKSFTMIPLYIMVREGEDYSSDRIKEFINLINEENTSYRYYFGSEKFGLKSDLKLFIKKKTLDKTFLVETLGEPDEVKSSLFGGKTADCLIFKKLGIRIYIIGDNAVGFDEI